MLHLAELPQLAPPFTCTLPPPPSLYNFSPSCSASLIGCFVSPSLSKRKLLPHPFSPSYPSTSHMKVKVTGDFLT